MLPEFNETHEALFVSGSNDSLASLYALEKKISTVILKESVFDSTQFCQSHPKGMVYFPTTDADVNNHIQSGNIKNKLIKWWGDVRGIIGLNRS